MSTVTVKAVLRNNYVKRDGTAAVLLRVTIDRRIKYYPLNIFIDPDDWDHDKGTIKRKDDSAFKTNAYIVICKKKVNDCVLNLQIYEKPITFTSFEELYLQKRPMTISALADDFMKNNSGRLCIGSLNNYKTEKNKLNAFRENIFLTDIDHKFLIQYENFMREKLGNCTNTVNKSFRKLRALVNYAHKINALDKNYYPFQDYKIKDTPVKRDFLTIDEVKRLIHLRRVHLSEKLLNTLNYFLFGIHTGLRFGDIYILRHSHIFKDGDIQYVDISTHKTLQETIIPLNKEALHCIAEAKYYPGKHQGDRIFNCYSNQKTNEYLKLLAFYAKINKHLTFHTARYTFASILLNHGMNMPVIQRLMAHANQKQTEKYAKFQLKSLWKALNAFDFK